MKNKLSSYDRIAKLIEDAVVRGSGYAASEAANVIDKEFILISKSDLPEVEDNQFTRNPTARTASYKESQKASVYFNRALDFLAVALYAEKEEVKQKEKEVAKVRERAYRVLYPYSNIEFSYSNLEPLKRRQIDEVVLLMTQVDELKASK